MSNQQVEVTWYMAMCINTYTGDTFKQCMLCLRCRIELEQHFDFLILQKLSID